MLASFKRNIGAFAALSAVVWAGNVANAQTLTATVTQPPSGPNSIAKVALAFDPAGEGNIEFSGFGFAVLYNGTLGSLTDADALQFPSATVIPGPEQANDKDEFIPPSSFGQFNVVLGDEYEDTSNVEHPWSSSAPFVELEFTMSPSYTSGMPFSFDVRKYGENAMIAGQDLSEMEVSTITIPPAIYENAAITGVTPDGTHVEIANDTITVSGSGFYSDGTGPAPDTVVKLGNETLTINSVAYNSIQATVSQTQLQALGQGTVALTVSNDGGSNSDSEDFHIVNRDTVFVNDTFVENDGELVAASSPLKIIGANAFKNISDGVEAVNAKATGVAGDVMVDAGSYNENVVVGKPLSIIGADSGSVLMGSAGAATQQQLITINSNGVAISGVGFVLDNTVGGGIVALGRTDLSVSDCKFTLPAVATGGKPGGGTLVSGGWGPKGIMFQGINAASSNVTLTNNEFANLTPSPANSYYQYAMHVELATGSITANKSIGAYRDLFFSQAAGQVTGNTFAMNIDVSNPAAAVTVENNDFGRTSAAFPGAPAFWHNEAALTVRAVQAGRSVTINNNDFENTARGVWVGASQNVFINNNRFTPSDEIEIDLGDQTTESANDYSHIIIDSKAVSSNTPSATTNYVTVSNNTFNGSAAHGHGLEFRNPVAGSTFSHSFSGNVFKSNVVEFVHIGGNFTNEVNLTNSTVSVNSETGTPAALALASLFALEDKTHHKLDSDGGPALVRWVAGNVYVTANSGSIQRGVNAASDSENVQVQDSTYTELVQIAKPGVKLIGNGLPTVTAPTTAENDAVIKVTASNVRIEGFDVLVNQPDAAVGIAAVGSTAAGIQIVNNNVQKSGTGGDAVNMDVGGIIPFGEIAGISVVNPSGDSMLGTVTGNTVGIESAPFKTFGIAFERSHGTVANNTIYGEDFDLLTRFVSNGATLNITGNNFNGWGDDGNKGAQVEVGDCAWSTVNVTGNIFTPRVAASTNGKVNRRSLQLKNHYSNQSNLNVTGNTFNVVKTGLALTNVYNSTVSGNTFKGAVNGALLLEINNKIYSSSDSHQDFDQNNATIQGNIFESNPSVANVKAIEFRDHTQGNEAISHPEIAFGNYVIGGPSTAANIFKSGLATFIRLDDSVGNTNTHPDGLYVNVSKVTVMEPVSESFVAKANLFNVGSGDKLPSAMELAEIASLNGKIYDRRDNSALGSVLLFERVTNTNTGKKFDYVQDAINDPTTLAGHTVSANAGFYSESYGPGLGLVINKLVNVVGPNAAVAGDATRLPEATIVPGVQLNGNAVADSNAVVKITAGNASIKGFSISGDNPIVDGLDYAGMDVDAATGIKVISEKAVVTDPYPVVDNVVIENNVITNLTYMGVFFNGYSSPSAGPHYHGARIKSNLIHNIQDFSANGFGYGLYLQAASGVVSGNKITNVRKGMQIQPYRVASAVVGENLVTGNIIEPWSIGVYYNYQDTGSSSWTIGGTGLSANTITAHAVPADAANVPWEGIRVEGTRVGSAGGIITGNVINGLTAIADSKHLNWNDYASVPAVWGMRLIDARTEGIAFNNNNVSNVQFGFLLESESDIPAAGFTGNTFAVAAGGDYIRLQNFRRNEGTVDPTGGAGNIDATNGNTYGTVASASAALVDLYAIEDKIEHALDNADLGLVRVVDQNLYVTVGTDGIQRGIDASTDGDTVNVAAGEYVEAGFYDEAQTYPVGVLVDKAVKLYGPNASNSASVLPLVRNPEATILPGEVLAGLDSDNPVVSVIANGAEVKGFSIKGDNVAVDSPHEIAGMDLEASTGLMSEANSVQIANNIVDGGSFIGIRSAGWFDNNSSWPNFENVHITGNLVRNFHSASYGYGIYMQGSTGTVNSNRVENVRQGMQIQPYNNIGTGLQANNNFISAWHRGLWFNYADPSASRWAIEGNTITASIMPASLGLKTLWEGIRAQGVHGSSAGVMFKLNNIDGAVAQTDPAHDNVGTFAEAVWGINTVSGTSNDVDLDTNTVANVSVALVHSAAGELALTKNNFTAVGDVISIQTATDVNGSDLATGGTGNIAVASDNTFNALNTGNVTLTNQYAIEDIITHKVDDVDLGLARVVANKLFVTQESGSINNAVEASANGDTVYVGAGSFGGATIDKLVAVLSGQETIAKAGITGPVEINIPAGTGAVSLDGFDFTGAGRVAVDGVNQDSATFSVANSSFTGSTGIAVDVVNAVNGVINNLEITGGTAADSIVLSNVENVDVTNSDIVNNNGSGIVVWKDGAEAATVSGVDITGNTIANNGVVITDDAVTGVNNFHAYGVLFARRNAAPAPAAVNVNIVGNKIEQNAATGIFLSELSTDDSGVNLVQANTVDSNGWSGVHTSTVADKNTDGIKINNSRNVEVKNNFFTNNQRYGVQVRGTNLPEAGEGVTLAYNHIFGNKPMAYNSAALIGGGLVLQLVSNPTQVIDADNNWWGHVYGPLVAVDNETGRGDAIVTEQGVAEYADWYGKRSYSQRWKALNDRDGDGLLDAEEDPNLLIAGDIPVGAAPINDKDSDNDGFEDGVEAMLGSDAFDPDDVPTYDGDPLVDISQIGKDKDGDGFWDFYEVAVGSNPDHVAAPIVGVPDVPELGDVDLTVMRRVIVLDVSIYEKTNPEQIEADRMDLNRDGAVSNLDSIALRRFQAETVQLPLDIPIANP